MSEQGIEGLETAIAVVGMSGRFPGSRDLKGFWRNLREGVESFSPLTDAELEASGVDPALIRHPDYVKVAPTLQDMEMFDAGFFGFSPRDASIMDPQQRHFLELSWEALEDAGYTPEGIRGAVGVFASSGTNAYLWQNLMSNPDLARDVGFFLLRHTGNDKDFLSTRVSYLLNLTGPSVNVQTACSSSLVGIHLATQSLLNGECDVALAGGVTIKQPHHIGYLYQEGEILSNDGHCRSFDADSLGTVFGSGAGVVVLKRAQEALEAGDHIYALVRGSAVNNDGARKVGFLAPSVDGQASAVAEALAVSGVEPESIGFLEAHGTGTPVGDPIEVTALTEAFRANGAQGNGFCVLGSVKTNIGHLDTASGVASFIKASLALHNGEIPATLHFRTPNPAVDFASSPFRVSAERTAWPRAAAPRRAAINSLGAGGTNAHVILEEAPLRGPTAPPKRPWELLTISGRSTSVVERASARLGSHLDTVEPADFPDVAHTLQVGRRAFKQRRIVAVKGPSDAVDALAAGDTKRVFTGTAPDRERSAAFLFAGGGAQYPHMGRELYDTEPVYREVVDRCLGLLRGQLDVDLRTLLYPAPGDEAVAAEELQRPSRALPALFTTQYAQARLWMSWGITPSAMIGHSMGEYTAACLSGVLTLEDALSIVTIRGKLFETLPEGAMISVPLPAEELRALLPPELSLAAINAPELSLAAGPVAAIEAFQELLREREVEGQRLHINVAAHSSMLDPILAPFREALGKIRFGKPEIPFVSNLSGTWITPEEAADPDYWVRHLRNTVDFAGGVAELLGSTDRVLLEVGPGRVLSTLARLHSARTNDHEVLSSMRHPGEEGSDVAFQLTTLGRLWIAGVPVDWESFQGEGRRRVPLPTYPFEHQPYWIEPGRKAAAGADMGPVDGSRKADLADWFWQPSWRRTSPVPALADRMEGEHVLVWGDAHGPAAAVEEALRRRGADVVSVRPGEAFGAQPDGSYTVHPGREGEIDRLFETLGAAGRVPGSIIHTLAATAPAPGGDLSGVEEAQDRAFHSLLGLARAVARAGWDGALRLSVLTRGAHQLASEKGGDPLQSLVTGPVAVIAREFPGVRTRVVDLAPGVTLTAGGRGADRIAAELLAPGAEQVVALRGRDRWVRTFEPLRLPETEQVAPRVREGSTWLITGGLGGLGLVFAGELASVRGVRLVLAGRTGLPSRDDWDAWIQAHGRDDRTAQAIEAIRELEGRGAQVVAAAVDITDLSAVRTLVREVTERFGRIQGVIHAAGVVEDALILNKERDSAARVLAPKVRGTLALEGALREHPPEVIVLFSSRGAVTGVAGQIDYASASAFLDAWARSRTSDDPDGPTIVSIDWSPWKEVGLAFELAREQMGDSRPRPRPMPHPLLDGVVEEEDTEVFSGLFPRGRHWMLDEHQIRGAHALIPGTGYLELARAAFTHRPGRGALLLRDLYFLEPFIVPDGSARAMRIRLTRKGDTARFSIQGAPADQARSEDARWQEHARGVAEWIDEAAPAPLDLESIRNRCSQRVVEGVQEKPHLQLGARWSSLQSMRFGVREALLEQELPGAFLGDLDEFHLHPALLDTATAGAQSLIEGFDESRDFYVPGSYTRLVQYRPVPARIRSHIRWRPNPDGDNQFAVFDVTVTDEWGEVVLEAGEFVMVRVDDRSRMVVEEILGDAPPAREEPVSAATMPADEDLPPMLREAIRTSEGIDLFRRVLAAEAPPQVIVSPHDLRAVLEGLDAPPAMPTRKVRSAPALDVTPVETLLAEHPAVKEAAVQVYQDRPGEQRLVAYVVYDPMERATVSELRRYLREGVDEALVPQNFLEMDALPRAGDGSVARGELEDPFAPVDDHVDPRTATEAVVANIWMDLLGADRVSVHDNFLDVGGHSLLAMRALLKIEKETGVRLNPSVMNMHTLEQIAAEIDEKLGGGSDGPDGPDPHPDPEPDPQPEAAQGLRQFLSDLVRG